MVKSKTFIQKLLSVKPHETKATLASFCFVFILMASYFILRPVRDALASDWSDQEVSFLWNINFFVSTFIVALYGYAISKFKFRNIVPIVYSFFAATFVIFYFGISIVEDRILIDKIFYLWVSVFSLFHISVFWSFMADTFNKEQAKRLFSVIAVGASAGALVGPLIPTLFAKHLGIEILMLIASCGLMLVIPIIFYIYRQKYTVLGNTELEVNQELERLGGNWWRGFHTFVRNSYFFRIGIFILLYVFISSFVYFEQKNLLADYSRVERVQILGIIDWTVNILTFGLAFFATGKIIKKFGMPITLALVPVFTLFGLLVLSFAPLITILLALQIARRAGNYAITRPAREMLYTEVNIEDRFKAKPVVDVVVYRGGDAASGTLFAFLTEEIGFSLAAVAIIGAGIAGLWTIIAYRLGQHYDKKSGTFANDRQSNTILTIKQT